MAEEDNLCVVCLEQPRETAFHPCRHTVCCQVCAALLKSCDDPCPFCREPITSWELGIFEATRMNAVPHRSATAGSTASSDEEGDGPTLASLHSPTSTLSTLSVSSASLGYCPAGDQPCVVCFTERPEVVLLPCGHKACCIVCATILKDQARPCPVCDSAFTSCKVVEVPDAHAALRTGRPPSGIPPVARSTATPPAAARCCVGCLGPTADMQLQPCGHAVCLLCGSLLRGMHGPCPVCEAIVADLHHRSLTPPLGSPIVPRSPQSAPPGSMARHSPSATITRRLLYPTLGNRFVSDKDEDYVVKVVPALQVVIMDRSGTELMRGSSHLSLRGFNYKFHIRNRPGVGSERFVLQIKGRGSASAPYYEILTPPPKFMLATCKGRVGRTHIWAHMFPRNQQSGPLLCEVLGTLSDARFSVKGPGGELLGHIAQGSCSAGHISLGVHVPAQKDALLLWMLAVLCTCLPTETGATAFPLRAVPDVMP